MIMDGTQEANMNITPFTYREDRELPFDQLIALYRANEWSSANTGEVLRSALLASHSLITAWLEDRLIGLGNAISDGYLVVYYPHLIVLPEFQGKGVGTEIMRQLKKKYESFHQHILVADGKAIEFYKKCGFERAGKTEAMWIYAGHDH
jgi:GNAT superfamily N-acetyltransferase